MNRVSGLLALLAQLLLHPLPAWSESDSGRRAIHPTAEDARPLMIGMRAPAFSLRTVDDEPFHFDPDSMDKPVVLTFFRGGWCPYCNLHLAELRTTEERLRELGFDVWFISMDQPALLRDSLEDPDIGYTLFSDSSSEATRAFGIAYRVDDETYRRYLTHDIDLEKASGESHHVLPVPATYLIGTDGNISFAYVNPSYAVRMHPSVLLAAVDAYRSDQDQRLRRQRSR